MSQEKIKRALDKMSYYTRSAKHYKEALAEINKIVMGCLPEENPENSDEDCLLDRAIGRNEAIAEFKANWEAK